MRLVGLGELDGVELVGRVGRGRRAGDAGRGGVDGLVGDADGGQCQDDGEEQSFHGV